MLKIHWDESQCCHAGVCVETLPEVFKIEDGKFCIDPTAADPDRIREVVSQCPSGALSIENESRP